MVFVAGPWGGLSGRGGERGESKRGGKGEGELLADNFLGRKAGTRTSSFLFHGRRERGGVLSVKGEDGRILDLQRRKKKTAVR